MNEQKMIEVLSQIEWEIGGVRTNPDRPAVGFDMQNWLIVPLSDRPENVCGTTACLAGHAMLADGWSIDFRKGLFFKGHKTTGDAEYDGAQILGLDHEDAAGLFYLDDLDQVYAWVARRMGIAESVLRDKVRDYR